MLSQRTRYTIRALLHLADRYGEGPVQLSEIAARQNIPPKFLTVMLSQMIREKLVASRRGRDGGYWLARPPARDQLRLDRPAHPRLARTAPLRQPLPTRDLQELHQRGPVPAPPGDADGPRRDCANPGRAQPGGRDPEDASGPIRVLRRKPGPRDPPRPPAGFRRDDGSEQYPEQRSAAVALADTDRAAMGEDDLAGEAEADSGAFRLGREEGQEDVLAQALRARPAPLSAISICTRAPATATKESDTAGASPWSRAASAALRSRLIRTWHIRSGSASSVSRSGIDLERQCHPFGAVAGAEQRLELPGPGQDLEMAAANDGSAADLAVAFDEMHHPVGSAGEGLDRGTGVGDQRVVALVHFAPSGPPRSGRGR